MYFPTCVFRAICSDMYFCFLFTDLYTPIYISRMIFSELYLPICILSTSILGCVFSGLYFPHCTFRIVFPICTFQFVFSVFVFSDLSFPNCILPNRIFRFVFPSLYFPEMLFSSLYFPDFNVPTCTSDFCGPIHIFPICIARIAFYICSFTIFPISITQCVFC